MEINAATVGCSRVSVAMLSSLTGPVAQLAQSSHELTPTAAMSLARTNIEAWSREVDGDGLDAVVIEWRPGAERR